MLPFLAILAKFLRNVPLFGQKSRFFRDIVPLFVFDGLVSMGMAPWNVRFMMKAQQRAIHIYIPLSPFLVCTLVFI